MSLTQSLLEYSRQSKERIPADAYKIMDEATQDLVAKHLSETAIQVGEAFPNKEMITATGRKTTITTLLEKGPLVVSFYRGGWCPYCNIELKALQQSLKDIQGLGGNLIAISPETPDNSLTTAEKNELTFEVLSDVGNGLASQLGLVFQMPMELRKVYADFGIDVQKHNGNNDFELPMPATFVLNEEGVVVYRFVDEHYNQRADVQDILQALEKI